MADTGKSPSSATAEVTLRDAWEGVYKGDLEDDTFTRTSRVDHENEISVHKIFSSTEADDEPPIEGYIIHEGGTKTWLNQEQAEALIDMLQILFEA